MTAKHSRLWVAALASLFSASAGASTVILDFDDLAYGTFYSNIEYRGYVISPFCHVDVAGWIGTDVPPSCSYDPPFSNPDYLGPAPGRPGDMAFMRIDRQRFNLDGLQPVSASSLHVFSSNGGFRTLDAVHASNNGWAYQSFAGPEWSDLDWLRFVGIGGTTQGFDNLALTHHAVPEPASWGLVGLGCILAFAAQRHRRPA